MSGQRIVQLIGIGELGRSFVEHSLAVHPRRVGYCSVEDEACLADPSPITRRIAVKTNGAPDPRRRVGSLEQQLQDMLGGVDACLLVGRCDEPFASETLPRAAACVAATGCLVVVVALLPFRRAPFGAWRRAAAALRATAGHADYLLPFPLSRIELWPEPGGGSRKVTTIAPRLTVLFEALDPVVTELLRPDTDSLLDTQRAGGAKACLASLRGVPLGIDSATASPIPWLGNDALTQLGLIRALPRQVIGIGGASAISLAAALEIAKEVDALLDPRGEEAASLTARQDDPGSLLLFAAGPTPARLLHLFADPGQPEPGVIGQPGLAWRAIEPRPARPRIVGATSRSSPAISEEALDLGGFVAPAMQPISAFYRIAPGALGLTPWKTLNMSSSQPAWPRWFGALLASPARRAASRPTSATSIKPGSVAARLDQLATTLETRTMAALHQVAKLPGIIRQGGVTSLGAQARARLGAAIAAARARRIRFEPLLVGALALLIVSPVVFATLGVETLASMSHTIRLSEAHGPEAVIAFEALDNARIIEASKAAQLTRKPFAGLGLSGSARVALAAHLDLLAIKSSFFGLEALGGGPPPFQNVDIKDTRAKGWLAMVLQPLASRSESRAVALNALGFFPSPEELARVSGSTVSDAASDIDTLFKDADGDGDHDDWAAGCGTVLQAVRARFDAKRGAPDDIELPDRSYILYLGFLGSGDCSERRLQAEAAYDALKAYSNVSVQRAVIANDALGQPVRVRYSVVLPDTIRTDIDADEEQKLDTPLKLYASGLRHLYLLEFDSAQKAFGLLARQGDATAAALGAYLVARTSFWKAAFAAGGYRPDLFPLSTMLSEDNPSSSGSTTTNDDGDRLERCRKGSGQPQRCVRQTYDRPADGNGKTVAVPALVAQARAALQRVPILKPTLLDKYDGSEAADDEVSEP